MKSLLLICSLFFLSTCNKLTQVETFTNEEGIIKIFVCSRGCYQYILEHKGTYYHPGELAEEFKENDKSVIFSGNLKDTKTAVNKPAPNDLPVFDFYATDIELTAIE